ncbi:MAG: YfbK domain-containing protein [Candidatus Sericytochromatia bacterium]
MREHLSVLVALTVLVGLSACDASIGRPVPIQNEPVAYPGGSYLSPSGSMVGYGVGPASAGNSYGTYTPVAQPSATSVPSAQPTAEPTASAVPTALPSASGQPTPHPTAPSDISTVPPADIRDYRDNFFENYGVNPFVEATTDPLSTFALDVDTASYNVARSYVLERRSLPPVAAVRTEEFLNAFDYAYPTPAAGDNFAIYTEMAPAYFGDLKTQLLQIGLQARAVAAGERKPANLTFVIDVSGSMDAPNRLELVKQSLLLLLERLQTGDQVSLVIYGSEARVVLEPTSVVQRGVIQQVIRGLRPEGATNAEAGLSLGYQQASKMFRNGSVNRVILCSDGVANVGATGPDQILARIRRESENGIALTTLGFGMDGFNDTLMEQLANQGDGNYGYISSIQDADHLLGQQLNATLQIIAKDAKVQVAFDPARVQQYRLLGYENRNVADADFRNDAIDAGEVGAGHSVTALYEVRLKPGVQAGNLATVSLRYSDVDDLGRIKEQARAVDVSQIQSFDATTPRFRLATAVAESAEILRQSVFAEGSRLDQVLTLLQPVTLAEKQVGDLKAWLNQARALQPNAPAKTLSTLVSSSENTEALPRWNDYLMRQLGGAASSVEAAIR